MQTEHYRLQSTIRTRTPIVTFTISPALRKVTLFAHSLEFIGIPGLVLLLWSQLTHIALHMSRIAFRDFECVLRRCNKLISLAFTSSNLDKGTNPTYTTSSPIIHLPLLQSLTLILGECAWNFQILEQLQVPAMKDFTAKHEAGRPSYSYIIRDQPRFMDMVNRSRCSLRTLNLSTQLLRIPFESLLENLPDLKTLVLSNSNPISGVIFDKVIRGEILQCYTPSAAP